MCDNYKKYEIKCISVNQSRFNMYVAVMNIDTLLSTCRIMEPNYSQFKFSNKNDIKKIESDINTIYDTNYIDEIIEIVNMPYKTENDAYQRRVKNAQVKSIVSYLEGGGIIPNSIIVAYNNAEDTFLEINNETLHLGFSQQTKIFNIIDGQHRWLALKRHSETAPLLFDSSKYELIVTIIPDMPYYLQAELFTIINGTQRRVGRSKVYDAYGYTSLNDSRLLSSAYYAENAVHRYSHHIVKVLNYSSKSPWYNKIKMQGKGPGLINQAPLVDNITKLIYTRTKRSALYPVLFKYYKSGNAVSCSLSIIKYLMGIRNAKREEWLSREYIFTKTNGVFVLFRIYHDLVCELGDPDTMTVDVSRRFWRNVSSKILKAQPGGSSGYQKQKYEEIMEDALGEEYKTLVNTWKSNIEGSLIQIGALS